MQGATNFSLAQVSFMAIVCELTRRACDGDLSPTDTVMATPLTSSVSPPHNTNYLILKANTNRMADFYKPFGLGTPRR